VREVGESVYQRYLPIVTQYRATVIPFESSRLS
jgi:hypothetical protein